MLKKTINYQDYNGDNRSEDFYFNLSTAEIAEMELSTKGGLADMIDRIVKAKDTPTIIKLFKEILLKAYGEKSPDGRRFVKSDEISTAFSQTEAYSQIFMRLATDEEYAVKFINAIVPKESATEAEKIVPKTTKSSK